MQNVLLKDLTGLDFIYMSQQNKTKQKTPSKTWLTPNVIRTHLQLYT